jgi:hypothetical protein
MSKKLVRSAGESAVMAAILTLLIDIGKDCLKQGHDINGAPVTPANFAALNRARALRDELQAPPP